jgi:polysaccharide biosynthesis protein PslH
MTQSLFPDSSAILPTWRCGSPRRSPSWRMTRALWVTAIPPDHDGGGGHIRQAYLLDALADRIETHLVVAGSLDDDRTRSVMASVREVSVHLPPEPRTRTVRRLRDLAYAASPDPSEVRQAKRIRRALEPLITAERSMDIVAVEFAGLARLVPASRRSHWALTLHNVLSTMANHQQAISSQRRRRLLYRLDERKARQFERWTVTAYDTVVVPTYEDAAEMPPGVIVVPNGVDDERYQPTPLPLECRVAFTGALYTLPNIDGIVWFVSEVWPHVRERLPGARLDIIGLRPAPAVLALQGSGVEVYPDVNSIVPYLQRARVAVVPLRIGTGSRLKALEAMASGRPVVGTTIGLGGLEIVPGVHALVADEPESLAEAVVSALTDEVLAARLGREGRSLVESRYSWREIGAQYVDQLLARVAAGSSTTRSR